MREFEGRPWARGEGERAALCIRFPENARASPPHPLPPSFSCASCTAARTALGQAATALGGLATPLSLDLHTGAASAPTEVGLDAAEPGLFAFIPGASPSARLAPGDATPAAIASLALDHAASVAAERLGLEKLTGAGKAAASTCGCGKDGAGAGAGAGDASATSTCGCGKAKAKAEAAAGERKKKASSSASSSTSFDPSGLPRAADFFGRGTDVRALDGGSFRALTRSPHPALVFMYANWCGHCQNAKGEVAAAAAALARAGSPAVVAALDCVAHKAACDAAGVRGFPTIKWFKGGGGGSGEDYGGPRSADAFESFVSSRARPPPPKVTQLTSAASLESTCLSSKTRLCLLAFLPHLADTTAADRKAALATLSSAAAPYAGRPYAWAWAGAGDHPALESAVGVGGYGWPAFVAVVPAKDDASPAKAAHLKGAFDAEGLRSFIEGARTGRVGAAPVAGELKVEGEVAEWDGSDAAVGGAGDDEFSLADLGLA